MTGGEDARVDEPLESAPATPVLAYASSTVLDETAFEEALVTRYQDLLRLATLLLGDRQDGEDAVQIALERAWRSRARLREPDRLDVWLRRIVAREAARMRSGPGARLRSRRTTILDLTLPAPTGMAPDVAVDLGRAFDRLPSAQRMAIVLHHYAGHPIDEIAGLLGLPRETVRSRIRLGMARLRRELGS